MVKLLDGETMSQAMRRDLGERVEKFGGIIAAMNEHATKIREAESQHDAFEIADRTGFKESYTYWVDSAGLPQAVKDILVKNAGRYHHQVQVKLAYPMIGGQSGGGGENVCMIILPWWSDKNARAIEIEAGCSHEMQTTNLGRCYNRYSCAKCGYSYTVDSGD